MQSYQQDEETQRANKLAELQAADAADTPLPADYKLNFLWFDKTLAIAVDQVMPKVNELPGHIFMSCEIHLSLVFL